MKGVEIAIDRLPDGRGIALRLIDGALDDLLIDPPAALGPAQPGAIFAARSGRPMKGLGGMFVDLGPGGTGFLREAKGLAPGTLVPVQVTSVAEPGKAPPVTRRLLLKSRYTILTPGRPGRNLSRRIRDAEERARLDALVDAIALSAGDGLILRSAAAGCDGQTLAEDIATLTTLRETVFQPAESPGLLLSAADAAFQAWRDWTDPLPDSVHDSAGCFADLGHWDRIDAVKSARIDLPSGAWISVEPTRALVAVDVNTGPDTSPAAGLKATIAALRALPRALRLRGLGGVIVIDPAPFPKSERKVLEQVARATFRTDPIETALAGWSPLGHLELQRKRERRPIKDMLVQ
ncbi:MAG: ribonuclease E/G [Pseudomonadota bacterium]